MAVLLLPKIDEWDEHVQAVRAHVALLSQVRAVLVPCDRIALRQRTKRTSTSRNQHRGNAAKAKERKAVALTGLRERSGHREHHAFV